MVELTTGRSSSGRRRDPFRGPFQARGRGVATLICLSTQAINYFTQKGGFVLGTPDDLPPARREAYDRSNRRSAVLVKPLATTAVA